MLLTSGLQWVEWFVPQVTLLLAEAKSASPPLLCLTPRLQLEPTTKGPAIDNQKQFLTCDPRIYRTLGTILGRCLMYSRRQ